MARSNPPTPLVRDLLVTPFFRADSWATLDLTADPPGAAAHEAVDLGVAVGADSLRQALILRLLTPEGSLADLGHAAYGSRLQELVGRPYNETLRLLARSFVLRAVAQEKRVAAVLALEVAPPSPDRPDTLRIDLRVQPAAGGDPLSLGIEVAR